MALTPRASPQPTLLPVAIPKCRDGEHWPTCPERKYLRRRFDRCPPPRLGTRRAGGLHPSRFDHSIQLLLGIGSLHSASQFIWQLLEAGVAHPGLPPQASLPRASTCCTSASGRPWCHARPRPAPPWLLRWSWAWPFMAPKACWHTRWSAPGRHEPTAERGWGWAGQWQACQCHVAGVIPWQLSSPSVLWVAAQRCSSCGVQPAAQ